MEIISLYFYLALCYHATMTKTKNKAAAALGSLGGRARARNLSKEQLSEIGRKGAAARTRNKEQRLERMDLFTGREVPVALPVGDDTGRRHYDASGEGFESFSHRIGLARR